MPDVADAGLQWQRTSAKAARARAMAGGITMQEVRRRIARASGARSGQIESAIERAEGCDSAGLQVRGGG